MGFSDGNKYITFSVFVVLNTSIICNKMNRYQEYWSCTEFHKVSYYSQSLYVSYHNGQNFIRNGDCIL